MRVRVWIRGAEGPAYDFELVDPPRAGERISVAVGAQIEEGIVADVAWRLIATERPAGALSLEAEPVGAVALAHVICRPGSPALATDQAALTPPSRALPQPQGEGPQGR